MDIAVSYRFADRPPQTCCRSDIQRVSACLSGAGEAKVTVQQYHALVRRRQRGGQVDRDAGLADTTFATGDRDHLHGAGKTIEL